MVGSASFQDFRSNASPVVPNLQSYSLIRIPDVRFDVIRVCMVECISQCLRSDAIDFVLNDRAQVPRWTFNNETERRGAVTPVIRVQQRLPEPEPAPLEIAARAPDPEPAPSLIVEQEPVLDMDDLDTPAYLRQGRLLN